MMSASQDDPHLLELILVFQQSAWIALGKIQNPASGKTEVQLEQAAHAIEMLTMLERKTGGNLSDTESKVLANALTQLRLNYVEAVGEKASEKAAGESGETSAADTPDGEKQAGESSDSGA